MTQNKMTEAIQKVLPDAQITIEDTTGTGDHFDIMVLSNLLEGLSRLQKHRTILDALEPLMESNGGPVHAIAIKTQPLPKTE